jgi:hypothetical protein
MLTPAPSPLPVTPPLPSIPSLEEIIGQITAAAATAMGQALGELGRGGLTPVTRMRSGDLVARLYGLRQACAGKVDFDFMAVARTYGTAALQARYGDAVDTRTITVLVDGVIEVLQKVVRSQLN